MNFLSSATITSLVVVLLRKINTHKKNNVVLHEDDKGNLCTYTHKKINKSIYIYQIFMYLIISYVLTERIFKTTVIFNKMYLSISNRQKYSAIQHEKTA